MKNPIYLSGELAAPHSNGPQIIAHVCNELGDWSGDIAQQIHRRWPRAKTSFQTWFTGRGRNEFGLGSVQFVNVNPIRSSRVVRVANMVATRKPWRPVNSRALRQCLTAVAGKAIRLRAAVHLPVLEEIRSVRWRELERLIRFQLCYHGIKVYLHKQSMILEPIQRPWNTNVAMSRIHRGGLPS